MKTVWLCPSSLPGDAQYGRLGTAQGVGLGVAEVVIFSGLGVHEEDVYDRSARSWPVCCSVADISCRPWVQMY